MRKLTITVSDEVYDGLYGKVGPGHISRFLDSLARPHVVDTELDADYRDLAADADREAEALVWADNLAGDLADEAR